ncbi:hypothetical protein BH10BAC5_BH10BAC5_05870 [soil metagenome]
MKFKLNKLLLMLTFALIIFTSQSSLFSQTKISFEKQNTGKKYKSFSFGMGAIYSNNSSLVDFVKVDLPNFSINPRVTDIHSLDVGIEFFGSAEFQISSVWSLKAEYSYFTKNISLPSGTNASYSYNSHIPLLNLSYIKRSDFIFFKFGAGIGYTSSTFTRSIFNSDTKYTASGFVFKPEITANAQLSNSVAGYISGFLDFKFTSDLKDDSGNDPPRPGVIGGSPVNLNSQGVGIRLGLSFYIF